MKIKKIIQSPFRKQEVKNLPNDAKEIQFDVNNNMVYYSESKQSYYVMEV